MTTPLVTVCYRPGQFVLPERYQGTVKPGRLASTPGDNLAEFGGKLCYHTLHTHQEGGRPSAEYHTHIRQTRHHSVYGHVVETFVADLPNQKYNATYAYELLAALVGRPGVWVTVVTPHTIRFCLSLRAVIEWATHGVKSQLDAGVGEAVYSHLCPLYPLSLAPAPANTVTPNSWVRRVDPQYPQEKWVSLYIEGMSRDALQDLVRHHYQTNFSVRSTRYVDEGESHQCLHPVFETPAGDYFRPTVVDHFNNAKRLYRDVYPSLTARGVDRKSARGAARSLLPGATETRMVYSLSEFQAKHLLLLRADAGTGAVDPEVKHIADLMRTALRGEGWAV